MKKNVFRGFFNTIVLTLTAVLLSVSFVACDEDNALNELNLTKSRSPCRLMICWMSIKLTANGLQILQP